MPSLKHHHAARRDEIALYLSFEVLKALWRPEFRESRPWIDSYSLLEVGWSDLLPYTDVVYGTHVLVRLAIDEESDEKATRDRTEERGGLPAAYDG
jgi:hypothetical protein